MADMVSAGARKDALPASDIYDLSTAWDAEAAEQAAFADEPYGNPSAMEAVIVWSIASILWTAIFAALLS